MTGVYITNTANRDQPGDVLVRDNIFNGAHIPPTPTNAHNGVIIASARRASITGNHFLNGATGIWLGSGSSDSFVANNAFAGFGTKVFDEGTTNTVYGWGAEAP